MFLQIYDILVLYVSYNISAIRVISCTVYGLTLLLGGGGVCGDVDNCSRPLRDLWEIFQPSLQRPKWIF